ncbi:MAG: enhanced serine sensitivity protein SseB C-terminal domain-containing protein [Oscillospiraceae bacterium]|nr:enhanced serine sensitivity protein SseB C-terminal domain-containing protein [Oscillospiraceae bacterium]MBR5722088.1 enhanced serine sensitivity protein SseB C-terminal domain-containing protein [Oscillospiraceae bacterium]
MPEPMQPITNPVLVDAMATFKLDLANRENAENFQEHEKAFLKAAIEARYLLPAMVEQPEEPQAEGEPQQARVAFQIMTNPKNEKFMPAFTDEVELKKNRKPGERFQVAVMSFNDLYRFMKANEAINGVVINPFGSALCLIRQQIIAIGDRGGELVLSAPMPSEAQPAPVPMPQPTNPLGAVENSREQQQDLIRQAMADMEAAKANADEAAEPETDPLTDDLLSALKGVLKKQKTVKKAFIRPETEKGERYLLIALDADESTDIEAISEALAKDCADYSDLPFDCVAASSIRAKELVAEGKPFYEKKRFGIF